MVAVPTTLPLASLVVDWVVVLPSAFLVSVSVVVKFRSAADCPLGALETAEPVVASFSVDAAVREPVSMTAKRDRVYALDRIRDIKRQYALALPQDIKLLSDLVEAQEDAAIRSLGNLVINEMRVFERNVDNL